MLSQTLHSDLSASELWKAAQGLFSERRFSDARALTRHISDLAESSARISTHGAEQGAAIEASIVIVSSKGSPLVDRCLTEVRKEAEAVRSEVVLVNNGNPTFLDSAKKALSRFTFVDLPANMGASVGRNVGVKASKSNNIILIDDDGIIQPNSVKSFLEIQRETGCSFARGKVLPLTQPEAGSPAHYDLGNFRRPYFLNCEGIAYLNKEVFLAVGGFDPLLFGHEGLELCARAWPFIGPSGFYYEPSAVLLHDYAATSTKLEDKKRRYKLMDEYIATQAPMAMEIYKPYRGYFNGNSRNIYSTLVASSRDLEHTEAGISVITTAWNAASVSEEYVKSWELQRYSNFEVIFVDDGSEDGTADLFQKLTAGKSKYKLIRSEKIGRGAALNKAIAEAEHDILAIADADDLSVPQRLSRINEEMRDSEVDLVSFITFNEQNMSRQGGFPQSSGFNDFMVRSLFGMPGQFPSYAFRRSVCQCQFSDTLAGGIDCDWLRRVLAKMPNLGTKLVQVPVVYYRQSAAQISKSHRTPQIESREKMIFSAYEKVLGDLTQRDKDLIRALSVERNRSGFDLSEITGWAGEFVRKNRSAGYYNDENLCWAISEAVHELAAKPATTSASAGESRGVLKVKSSLGPREKFMRETRRIGKKARMLLRNPGA